MLEPAFFQKDALTLAKALIGKMIRSRYGAIWLSAQIIETEAYYLEDKASHASLGFTQKRKALFMPAGTIYMYYARGDDSLNISAQGDGNAVLIKSGYPYQDAMGGEEMIATMQRLNPVKGSGKLRDPKKLCSGQTLLCRSLNLRVPDWDTKTFSKADFYIEDVGYTPTKIIQTKRLGIPLGRDEHLEYRIIDYDFADYATSNPLRKKSYRLGEEYKVLLTS